MVSINPDQDRLQAERRLSEIVTKAAPLEESVKAAQSRIQSLVDKVSETADQTRSANGELANLKAEAHYLVLKFGLGQPELPRLELRVEVFRQLWEDVRRAMEPVPPSPEWQDRIREAQLEKKEGGAPLSPEERADLQERLKETVCPICSLYALDGTCTLTTLEECPIHRYLNRLTAVLEKMGHSPWMEDYLARVEQEICPACRCDQENEHCVAREEGDCALVFYLPAIVKTVEAFMNEKTGGGSVAGPATLDEDA